jgi:hypothetical protein
MTVVGSLVAVGALLVGRGLLRFAGVFGWG